MGHPQRGGNEPAAAGERMPAAELEPAWRHLPPGFAGADCIGTLTRILLLIGFAATTVCFVIYTRHWKLMLDSPVMHYVNFLMAHGRLPYSQISDNNFPGAYYTEGLAMRVFGAGDVGWRLYDFFLCGALTGALILIARTRDWMAGLFAGVLFLALHGADGPGVAAERDLEMSVLFAMSYAASFAAVRRRVPALMLAMGLCGGLAVSIKPSLLPPALLLLVMVELLRRRVAALPYLLYALAGFAAFGLFDLAYLGHYHALSAFVEVQRLQTTAYAHTLRMGAGAIVAFALQRPVQILLALAVILGVMLRGRRSAPDSDWPLDWEWFALAAGAALEMLSFFVQGKDMVFHRYGYLPLLLLLIGFELFAALRARGLARWLALAGFALVLFRVMPSQVRSIRGAVGGSEFTSTLEADLNALGGAPALDDKVLCLDIAAGCLNALYHDQLVENTSFTGDLMLFAVKRGPMIDYYLQRLFAVQSRDPAGVIVVSNQWFGPRPFSFDKLDQQPRVAEYLRDHYTVALERSFPYERVGPAHPGQPSAPESTVAYRLYVRNDSPLLARARVLWPYGR